MKPNHNFDFQMSSANINIFYEIKVTNDNFIDYEEKIVTLSSQERQ